MHVTASVRNLQVNFHTHAHFRVSLLCTQVDMMCNSQHLQVHMRHTPNA